MSETTDLTDYAKTMLGRALCGRQPALPLQVFLGLGTGGTDDTGLTGEPAGRGYARQRVSFTGTQTQRNLDALRFTFTEGVGTLTHAGLFDAASGGNPLSWGVLTTPVTVSEPGTVTLEPGELRLTPA